MIPKADRNMMIVPMLLTHREGDALKPEQVDAAVREAREHVLEGFGFARNSDTDEETTP